MPQANTHMSHRPTYVDYSSPDSEHSEYFDAPMMRFFSQSTSKTSTPDLAAAAAEEERAPSRAGSTLPIQADDPSAALASLSITADDYRPVNTDSEEESPRGVQLQDPPVDSANRKNRQSDDSGYGSTHRAKNMTVVEAIRSGDEPDEEDGIKPIPVVWSDTAVARRVAGDSPAKRTSSLRSFRSQPNGEGRRASGNHHRSASLSGGSFLNGPGTVGPNSELPIDESLRQRRVAADALLTKKQKLKIGKAELKEGKRLGKIIKQEAKAEKKALNISMRELSEIQKTQKVAIKEEEKSYTAHAKALRAFHKEELAFMAAKAKFQKAQAELQAHEDAREASRQHALEATEMLQEKNREVEYLRAQKAADDREREAKLRQLAGKA